MADLKKLFSFYLDHQVELLEQYDGKYLVITDDGVVGNYSDQETAYFDAEKKYGLGNFLIQLCTPGDEAYTQYFASRVTFE